MPKAKTKKLSDKSSARTKTKQESLIRHIRSECIKTCMAEGITDPGAIRQLTLRVTQGITPGSIAAIKAWNTIRTNRFEKSLRQSLKRSVTGWPTTL